METEAHCRGSPLLGPQPSPQPILLGLLLSSSVSSSSPSSIPFRRCETHAERMKGWFCVSYERPPGAMGMVFTWLIA